MKRALILTFVLAVCAAGEQANPSVAVVVDVSRSTQSVFEASKREQQALIAALPNGSQCVILTAGGTANRIFEGRLDANRRAEAQRVVGALAATEWNSDLAAGVIDALASVASSPGPKEIWMFTDGDLRPRRGSPYRGRTFASVLSDVQIGPGTKVFVRLIGNGKLVVTRPQISVITAAPDWPSHYRGPAQTPPAAPTVKPNYAVWWAGSAVALIAALLTAGMIWRHMEAENDQRALQAVLAAEVEEPAKRPAGPVRTYKVRQMGGATFELDPDGTRELIIGDGALADIELTGAEGSGLRLRLEGKGSESAPVLENTGRAAAFVGSRRLGTGDVRTLPKSGCELRVGRELFFIYPEIRNGGAA